MQLDEIFWIYLELLPNQAAALHDWNLHLCAWSPYSEFKNQFLLPTPDTVSELDCSTICRPACSRWVFESKESGLVSVCRDFEQTAIPLLAQDILVYKLNQRVFNRCVCEALGIDCHDTKMKDCRHTWYLGAYIYAAGTTFPVFLCQPDDTENLIDSARVICLDQIKPFAFIVLTRKYYSLAAETLLTQRKNLLLVLNEEVGFTENATIKANRAAKEVFSQLIGEVSRSNETRIYFFPTPLGTWWEDLIIKVLDGHTILATIGEVSIRLTFSQMDMENRNTGGFNEQWKLLLDFAKAKGKIDWNNRYARETLKKQKQLLCKHLREVFRLEGDPIRYDPITKAYYCRFRIFIDGYDDESEEDNYY